MKNIKSSVILAINDKAALVVQNSENDQPLYDAVDRAEALAGIRRGLEQMENGEGKPAEEVLADMRQNYGLAHG